MAVILGFWLVAGFAARRNRDLVLFVSGLALMALAFRALGALH